ncbi:substrate-binding domain-containing protein [Candidatus Woesearchaeota archaeon]|nr:substrate-binding domain-containing protein [Candidatus Woesearchaeota archaeon]
MVLLVLALFLIGGCGGNAATKTPTESAPASEKIVIGFSLGTLKEDRWQRDRDNFVAKAQALGAEVVVESANADPAVQTTQVGNLIAQGVDVLVIVPEDGELAASYVEKAHAAGIKVLAYDRIIKNSDLDLYVSFQNEKVGELQAKGILELVNKGKFVYIGGAPTDNNAFQFKAGAMDVIQPKIDSGDIELVFDKMTDEWKPANAYANMKSYLDTGGEVDAVIAANDGTAGGVIQALTEKGLAGKVPVSGQDAELAACQRIVEGTQTLTVFKNLKPLAEKGAEIAVAMAKGEQVATNGKVNNGKIDVPSVLLDPVLVTKANMMDTVIALGFQSYDAVYQNVPADQRPAQ